MDFNRALANLLQSINRRRILKSKRAVATTSQSTSAATAPGDEAPAVKARAATRKAVRTVVPDLEELIRSEAYLRSERRGFAPGGELEDWLGAEQAVRARVVSSAMDASGAA
jgi:hypothetical protein